MIVVAGGGDESRALLGELIGERAINLASPASPSTGQPATPKPSARSACRLRPRHHPGRTIQERDPPVVGTPISFGGIPSCPGTSSSATPTASSSSRREQAIAVAEAAEAVFDDETDPPGRHHRRPT